MFAAKLPFTIMGQSVNRQSHVGVHVFLRTENTTHINTNGDNDRLSIWFIQLNQVLFKLVYLK